MLRELDFLVSTHVNQISKSELAYGPPIALVEFLQQRELSIGVIFHPFFWSYPSSSRIELFSRKDGFRRLKLPKIPLPEPLAYIKDMLVSIGLVLRLGLRTRLYIGADGVNTIAGLFLRGIGRVHGVVFYSIDYTPVRFSNAFLNGTYHALDRLCARHADFVWNLSSRMAKVRSEQGVEPVRNLVVPVGTKDIPLPLEKERQPKSIAFVSHLELSKGPKLILDAMPDIVKRIPDAKLVIIGGGPEERKIQDTIKAKHLSSNVTFLGPMSHDRIMSKLPYLSIGLAPYPPLPNSITWYADPTKVKDYLSCGLPVILTDVPEVANEIAERKAGTVIPYSATALANAVVELLSSDHNLSAVRKNASELASAYSWDQLFTRAIRLSDRTRPSPRCPEFNSEFRN
jgi:glycosyltransferase involved in cell wall biosynthesis